MDTEEKKTNLMGFFAEMGNLLDNLRKLLAVMTETKAVYHSVTRSLSFEGLLPRITSLLAPHLAPPLRLFIYFPIHTTNQYPPLLYKPILRLPAPYIPRRA
jgi:hypothetical protein